jgi:hypothetical protein
VYILRSTEPGVDDVERPTSAQLDQPHVDRCLRPFPVPAKGCATPSLDPGSSPATIDSSKSPHVFFPHIEVALIGFGASRTLRRLYENRKKRKKSGEGEKPIKNDQRCPVLREEESSGRWDGKG